MFDTLCRMCTGETLEISQEMTIQNGDTTMIDHDTEAATAMMLKHPKVDVDDDDDLGEKLVSSKLNNKRNKIKKTKQVKEKHSHGTGYARTAAFIVTSSIYGQLLVVVCIAFFIAKIVTPKIPLHYFEAFYLYLYSMSLLFLLYVYFYLLNDVPKVDTSRVRSFESKSHSKISETDRSHASIFLRIGSIVFGLGVMIYNGLEFGAYFEIPYESPCYSLLLGVNPILQAAFTFAQMYFIFTYSRLMINKFKLIARIGLMHLVGTNICVWIRTLGKETLHELRNGHVNVSTTISSELVLFPLSRVLGGANRSEMISSEPSSNASSALCQKEAIMGSILVNASPYLYPFIVEYSLIAAAFLYIMWCTIGKRNTSSLYEDSSLPSPCHQMDTLSSSSRTSSFQNLPALYNCLGSSKVVECLGPGLFSCLVGTPSLSGDEQLALDSLGTDTKINCQPSSNGIAAGGFTYNQAGAHYFHATITFLLELLQFSWFAVLGLFTGFLFLAISVTSLIIFFVLVHHPNYSVMASLLSDISHSVLLVLSSIAILVGFFKTRNLKFKPGVRDGADSGLRDLLLRIAAFGLYSYSLFGVIASAFELSSLQHIFVLVTSVLTIVQVTLQTLFISDVVCRKRCGSKQPGRQLITFLLINNLTLWIVYTFEMQKLEASPIQLSVYGFTTWAVILRFTLPLSIFYRFHSAITFAEVWKNSYKPSMS